MHGDDTSWIQTFTGRRFWPLDPRADDVDVIDIAHALSLKCRFTGHCTVFYSVAQHSVLVSANSAAGDELWGLLHDAAEAYLADLARPVKHSPDFGAFRVAEERIMRAITLRFGLRWPEPASVKRADLILLRTERRDLMGPPPRPWRTDELAPPLETPIFPLAPARAEQQFLYRFRQLIDQGATAARV